MENVVVVCYVCMPICHAFYLSCLPYMYHLLLYMCMVQGRGGFTHSPYTHTHLLFLSLGGLCAHLPSCRGQGKLACWERRKANSVFPCCAACTCLHYLPACPPALPPCHAVGRWEKGKAAWHAHALPAAWAWLSWAGTLPGQAWQKWQGQGGEERKRIYLPLENICIIRHRLTAPSASVMAASPHIFLLSLLSLSHHLSIASTLSSLCIKQQHLSHILSAALMALAPLALAWHVSISDVLHFCQEKRKHANEKPRLHI